MLLACLPFGPWVTSKLTFWPSFRVLKPCIWIAEKCANRSSPPSSGVMNPYPFASLNHLTVPVAIQLVPYKNEKGVREEERARRKAVRRLRRTAQADVAANRYE